MSGRGSRVLVGARIGGRASLRLTAWRAGRSNWELPGTDIYGSIIFAIEITPAGTVVDENALVDAIVAVQVRRGMPVVASTEE